MANPDYERPFEQALEHCLQDLTHGGDIEVCLQRYSQHADQLRPLLEMAQLARHYYEFVPEPPGGLVSGRERLLATAAQQRTRTGFEPKAVIRTTRSQSKMPAFAMRFVGVLLAIIMSMAALGGGIVWAANDSLPDDLLYPVKITVEDVRLAFTSAPQDQIDLALEFAEERVEEIQGLSAIDRQAPDKAIARMEQHIEQAMIYAAQISSDEEMVDALEQITVRTRTQVQVLEQMQFTASQQTYARLVQAAAIYRRGADRAEIGQSDLHTFRLQYHHQPGDPELTNGPEMMPATPGNTREYGQGQYLGCQECECTPTLTPSMTPQGPRSTSEPQPTPQGPQSTSEPQPTPNGSQATPHSQTTPPGGSQATPGSQSTSQNSQATPKSQSTPQGRP